MNDDTKRTLHELGVIEDEASKAQIEAEKHTAEMQLEDLERKMTADIRAKLSKNYDMVLQEYRSKLRNLEKENQALLEKENSEVKMTRKDYENLKEEYFKRGKESVEVIPLDLKVFSRKIQCSFVLEMDIMRQEVVGRVALKSDYTDQILAVEMKGLNNTQPDELIHRIEDHVCQMLATQVMIENERELMDAFFHVRGMYRGK